MVIQEVRWGSIDWIDLAQDRERCAGVCECGDGNSDFIKCGEFLD
jgi:hypothetical protein